MTAEEMVTKVKDVLRGANGWSLGDAPVAVVREWLGALVQAVEDQQRRLRALPIEEMRTAIAEYDECVARWGAATDDLGKDRAAIRGVELFGKGDAAKWIRQLVGMVG